MKYTITCTMYDGSTNDVFRVDAPSRSRAMRDAMVSCSDVFADLVIRWDIRTDHDGMPMQSLEADARRAAQLDRYNNNNNAAQQFAEHVTSCDICIDRVQTRMHNINVCKIGETLWLSVLEIAGKK